LIPQFRSIQKFQIKVKYSSKYICVLEILIIEFVVLTHIEGGYQSVGRWWTARP